MNKLTFQILYRGEVVRSCQIEGIHGFVEALKLWARDVLPAVKRGDEVTVKLMIL